MIPTRAGLTKEQIQILAEEFTFVMLTDSYVRGEARDRVLRKFYSMIGYDMRNYPRNPTPELAERAYEIAVQECGAPEDEDTCARWVALTQQDVPKESRVCHLLGGGGKLRYNPNSGFYINMYPEDETPRRLRIAQKANDRLAELNKELSNGT